MGEKGRRLATEVGTALDAGTAGGKVVGAVVRVVLDGELVLSKAAGHANREAGAALRDDAIFRLASMTKAMVSATARIGRARQARP